MTISVTRNGTAVSSDIKFTKMSAWNRQTKYTEHEVYGADADILHYRGRKSATCTLEGYCRRTQANIIVLDSLADGSTLSITHDIEGTRSGVCTALSSSTTEGGVFIVFSITVVEQ